MSQDWFEFEVTEAEAPRLIAERGVSSGGKRKTRGDLPPRGAPDGGTRIEFELAFRAAAAQRAPRPLPHPRLRQAGQRESDAPARQAARAADEDRLPCAWKMPRGRSATDLAELLARRALTEDAARPDAVERRHAAGGRTARENIADLVDPGSFVEYGALRDRRPARAPRARGPDRAHPRRRPRSAAPRASTASSSASAPPAPCSPTTTRCWPGPRARSGTARRTASSS